MPLAPLRPCKQPRCPELVASGYCAAHKRQVEHQDCEKRGTAAERGYDKAWEKCRSLYLAKHPWCELKLRCKDAPLFQRLATEVHHVQPISEAPELRLDWSNLRACCGRCHNAVTPAWGRAGMDVGDDRKPQAASLRDA